MIPASDIPELANFQRSFVTPPTEQELDPDHIPPVMPPMSNYDLFDGLMSQSLAMVNPRKARDLWLNRRLCPVLSELQLGRAAQQLVRAEELEKLKEVEVNMVHDRSRKCSRKSPVRRTRQSKPVVQFQTSSEEEEEEESTEEDCHSSDVDWQVSELRQRRKQPIIIA